MEERKFNEEEQALCGSLMECGKAAKEEIKDAQMKVSDFLGNGFKCMDHDKIIVFIREVKLRDMTPPDRASAANNLFVEMSMETTPKIGLLTPDMFIHRTGTAYNCDINSAHFPMRSQVHFNSTIPQIRARPMTLKVFNVDPTMGNILLGETEVPFDLLLQTGWGQDVFVDCHLQKV